MKIQTIRDVEHIRIFFFLLHFQFKVHSHRILFHILPTSRRNFLVIFFPLIFSHLQTLVSTYLTDWNCWLRRHLLNIVYMSNLILFQIKWTLTLGKNYPARNFLYITTRYEQSPSPSKVKTQTSYANVG